MTAADRPTVPQAGDTLTTAEQLDAMPVIREAQARALTDAADRLSGATEGPQREGTARWPQVHREVYSLAIEEAQAALRNLATTYTERAD
ncbi:hypothetical protein [Pseudactinotalea sp. Z1748]|uniref:hypothetical protein n=1 Tax=Pseudactinotalea sp. Z1748 TaxID=3413027 RepID=UPI003C7A44B2